jgi:hypothetical protein
MLTHSSPTSAGTSVTSWVLSQTRCLVVHSSTAVPYQLGLIATPTSSTLEAMSFRPPLKCSCLNVARSVLLARRNGACHATAPDVVQSTEAATRKQANVVSYSGVEFVVDFNPELKSTWGQRVTVLVSAAVSGSLLAQGVVHSANPVVVGFAVVAGFIFSGAFFLLVTFLD